MQLIKSVFLDVDLASSSIPRAAGSPRCSGWRRGWRPRPGGRGCACWLLGWHCIKVPLLAPGVVCQSLCALWCWRAGKVEGIRTEKGQIVGMLGLYFFAYIFALLNILSRNSQPSAGYSGEVDPPRPLTLLWSWPPQASVVLPATCRRQKEHQPDIFLLQEGGLSSDFSEYKFIFFCFFFLHSLAGVAA